MAKAVKSSTYGAADRAAHDAVMLDIEELRNTAIALVVGEYKMPPKKRAPRKITRDLMQALAEKYPLKRYPKRLDAIRADLEPIYKREVWGPVPDRNAIARAIGRQKPSGRK